ncbi:MAG TPA: response regulator transcription factor, partial [Bacteroidota bacterium]|nr:response regulator transcription factor [Bacteroidota bacterium]
MKARILIVDDHPIVRQGLRSALDRSGEVEIVDEASDGDEAIDKARAAKPDLLLLDISMPGKNGLEVLKVLHAEMPQIRILILSTFPEKQYAVRCFANGARGYLTKKSAPEELLDAIRKIMSGGKYVSASLGNLLADEIGSDVQRLPHERLSDREFQVLCLLGQGKTVSQIAETLSLSLSTINTYRAHILEKMKMETTAELVRYALDNNLS